MRRSAKWSDLNLHNLHRKLGCERRSMHPMDYDCRKICKRFAEKYAFWLCKYAKIILYIESIYNAKNYHCEYCDYRTGRKSSYTSHLNSAKHTKNISLYKSFRKASPTENQFGTKNVQCGTKIVLEGTKNVPYSCSYCEKTLSCSKSLNRHYRACKAKLIHDQKKLLENKLYEKDEQLLEKDKKLDELKEIKEELKELKEIKHDYYDLLKEIAKSKTSPKTINIHYVINNFTDALNYEDLMKPALTNAEIEKIEEAGPLCGIVFMIENRCINNIDVKK